MQYIFLLCLLILQQTIYMTSFVSSGQSPVNDVERIYIARRSRAPLMGRSITTLDDDIDLIKNDSNDSSGSDENDIINVDKRRYALGLFGRRKWTNPKRKGPLFG